MKYTLLTSILFVSLASFGQGSMDTVRIQPIRVTDQIYMLKGSGGNIGVLIGNEGTLMIDNQFAPLSNKINGAIKTLDPGEIRFAINTHVHGDHSGGNEKFYKMGATLVAHDNVRMRMTKETVNVRTNKTTPPARPTGMASSYVCRQIEFSFEWRRCNPASLRSWPHGW